VSCAALKLTSSGDATLPSLVLVHGWGHHSGVWQPLVAQLQGRFQIHLIDLPGYGDSELSDGAEQQAWQLETLFDAFNELSIGPAIWCGWSLGGMLATQYAAAYPERVAGLVTIASNALFVEQNDWPRAMSAVDYEQFATSLKADAKTTLSRFLALVSQGSPTARADLRQLKKCASGATDTTLQVSLDLLSELDSRPSFAALAVPNMHVFGELDALVPVSASASVAQLNDCVEIKIIEAAGHAPFLSHTEQVIDVLENMAELL